MKFKTKRIEHEFEQLKIKNANLYDLLIRLEDYCDSNGLEEPIITCILRTEEENKACGGIPNSPHLKWEGADLRGTIYHPDEIKELLTFLNGLGFTYGVNKKLTAIYHKVPGGTVHFHLQRSIK